MPWPTSPVTDRSQGVTTVSRDVIRPDMCDCLGLLLTPEQQATPVMEREKKGHLAWCTTNLIWVPRSYAFDKKVTTTT
jgi:hypothetical protein